MPCNVQVISNIIDFDMNIAEAIAAPRTFHGWIPDKLLLQKNTTTSDTKKILEDIGHHVVIHEDIRFGPAMGIWIDPETNILYGACDPRSMDGEAVGY
nr:gamma-glutamyltransferase [Bacteroidota bacterium]